MRVRRREGVGRVGRQGPEEAWWWGGLEQAEGLRALHSVLSGGGALFRQELTTEVALPLPSGSPQFMGVQACHGSP